MPTISARDIALNVAEANLALLISEWEQDVGVPYYSMRAHDALDVSIAPHDPAPPNA